MLVSAQSLTSDATPHRSIMTAPAAGFVLMNLPQGTAVRKTISTAAALLLRFVVCLLTAYGLT